MICATTTDKTVECERGGRFALPPRLKAWCKLGGWVLALWFFAYVFAPWLQSQSTSVRTLSDYISSSGIDAGAIYYTEVEEVGDADLMIRDTFRFFLPQNQQ